MIQRETSRMSLYRQAWKSETIDRQTSLATSSAVERATANVCSVAGSWKGSALGILF